MKRYHTIVADPPWSYSDKLSDGPRGAEAHYACMDGDGIKAVPVGDWAEDDAHLYLWTTNAFMVEAHEVARTWGFTVRTIGTWAKPGIGLGHFFRNNTEHFLFGVRGKLPVLRHDLPTAFNWPRGRHSEKPAAFFDMVESMSPGPYLEVFARLHRFNWDAWGNEVYSFNEVPA